MGACPPAFESANVLRGLVKRFGRRGQLTLPFFDEPDDRGGDDPFSDERMEEARREAFFETRHFSLDEIKDALRATFERIGDEEERVSLLPSRDGEAGPVSPHLLLGRMADETVDQAASSGRGRVAVFESADVSEMTAVARVVARFLRGGHSGTVCEELIDAAFLPRKGRVISPGFRARVSIPPVKLSRESMVRAAKQALGSETLGKAVEAAVAKRGKFVAALERSKPSGFKRSGVLKPVSIEIAAITVILPVGKPLKSSMRREI